MFVRHGVTLTSVTGWAALAVLVIAAIVGASAGLPLALLFLAGMVLVGVVFLFWSSLQSLTGETELSLDEAVGLAAPSAEEERKRAVLRALKDLEYERSVGKISEEDYQELSSRYRSEAKGLLQSLDAQFGPARRTAEELLAERLAELRGEPTEKRKKRKKRKKTASRKPADTPAPETPEARDEGEAAAKCGQCGTRNDSDARFCKGCGAALDEKDGP